MILLLSLGAALAAARVSGTTTATERAGTRHHARMQHAVPAPLPAAAPDARDEDARRRTAPDNRIVLGVMRSDGVLLPFASYNGRRWASRWPVEVGRNGITELPMNLEAIPDDWWDGAVPDGWRLWPTEEQPVRPFKLLSPVVALVGLSRRLGLRTDIPPRPLPIAPFELPFPKEGLAAAGAAEPERIANVSRSSPEWQRLPHSIRRQVDAAEERTINAIRSANSWRHPYDKAARGRVTAGTEAWYVAPHADSEKRLSYVELVKKYPPRPEDEGCGLETFVSGWVHHGAAEDGPKADLKAVVTYCDRARVSYMLPLGLFRLRDRMYWVFQMSGRDHEWYEIVEAVAGRVRYVVESQGGVAPAGLFDGR